MFTVIASGYHPRSALDATDGAEVRLGKIAAMIGACDWGIHDLSRVEVEVGGVPRFNMPMELGIHLGARLFGEGRQRRKRALILETEPHRYDATMSDISGQDIEVHDNDPDQPIAASQTGCPTTAHATPYPCQVQVRCRPIIAPSATRSAPCSRRAGSIRWTNSATATSCSLCAIGSRLASIQLDRLCGGRGDTGVSSGMGEKEPDNRQTYEIPVFSDVLRLSPREWAAMIGLLADPPGPSPRLIRAVKLYNEFLRKDSPSSRPRSERPRARRLLSLFAPSSRRHSKRRLIVTDHLRGYPPRYLRTPEAARFLGLSGRTLEKHRVYGTGPRFAKLGGRVVYSLDDLQAWVARGKADSTSDIPRDGVLPAKPHAATAPIRERLDAKVKSRRWPDGFFNVA